ncbi:hypothetical protein HOLleu_38723 [Holothuria leucospilota]|uniref:Uncharacterized protein n=1 Tax=Holothuria leucospilota TaxID=206669 RepID=A0A9Q0YEY0_HOLLE|nr:hypothetical protein HOLleu_38723 [Holothuria leucospilota]
MLGNLSEDKKGVWKTYVAPLVHAYNWTRNDSTSFSPFNLMFGYHVRLPIDLFLGRDCFENNGGGGRTHYEYADSLRNGLGYAYELASTKANTKSRAIRIAMHGRL